MWTTSTGSVASTQTIRISPSASSSTPSRSIRRVLTAAMVAGATSVIEGAARGSGGCGAVAGTGGRGPLRLERLAQTVLRVLERHACDDGLEEPEDDELAR